MMSHLMPQLESQSPIQPLPQPRTQGTKRSNQALKQGEKSPQSKSPPTKKKVQHTDVNYTVKPPLTQSQPLPPPAPQKQKKEKLNLIGKVQHHQ